MLFPSKEERLAKAMLKAQDEAVRHAAAADARAEMNGAIRERFEKPILRVEAKSPDEIAAEGAADGGSSTGKGFDQGTRNGAPPPEPPDPKKQIDDALRRAVGVEPRED
jgi:hypothetical protein